MLSAVSEDFAVGPADLTTTRPHETRPEQGLYGAVLVSGVLMPTL